MVTLQSMTLSLEPLKYYVSLRLKRPNQELRQYLQPQQQLPKDRLLHHQQPLLVQLLFHQQQQLNLQIVSIKTNVLRIFSKCLISIWHKLKLMLAFSNITGTIKCDFDENQCGFTTKSEGNDASKKGFNWIRHSASWVTSNEELEGPSTGMIILKNLTSIDGDTIILYLIAKKLIQKIYILSDFQTIMTETIKCL